MVRSKRSSDRREASTHMDVLPKLSFRECGCLSEIVLSYISSLSSALMLPKGSSVLHSESGAQAPEGHCATAYLANGSVNDYVRYLPTSKDSPKAVPTMKRGNIPFGKPDLAAIVLASVPMM